MSKAQQYLVTEAFTLAGEGLSPAAIKRANEMQALLIEHQQALQELMADDEEKKRLMEAHAEEMPKIVERFLENLQQMTEAEELEHQLLAQVQQRIASQEALQCTECTESSEQDTAVAELCTSA